MKYFFNVKSLKNEILINDLIVISFIFLAIVSSTIFIYANVFFEEINTKNEILAHSITYQITEDSNRHIELMNAFAINFESLLVNSQLPSNIILNNLKNSDSMFLQIQVLDNKGTVLLSSNIHEQDLGLNFSNQPYFTNLKNPGSYKFSNSFLSEKFSTVITAFSMRTSDYYYVALLDLSHYKEHLDSLKQDDAIKYLILDSSNTIISSNDDVLVNTRTKYDFLKKRQGVFGKYELIFMDDVHYMINKSTSDLLGWQVVILNDIKTLLNPIKQVIMSSTIIATLLLIVYTIYKKKRIYSILRSINELKQSFNDIAQGDYDIKSHSPTYSEFFDLSNHFSKSVEEIEMREEEIIALNDNLELLVNKRTEELNHKNNELNIIVTELQDTQTMLIQSEKLASFSWLLAGIAHEVNTPIGVSITSCSYLSICIKELQTSYKSGTLSKVQFKESIDELEDLADMVLKNVLRAGDLITTFKKASGDNFYDDLAKYNLYELVSNLTKSMKLKLKDQLCHVDLEIPSKLLVHSYPSAMSQIFTNLISNSLSHGFKNRKEGHILIKATEIDDQVIIEYKDNGEGIKTEMYEKVFDPFFTTNRMAGGTGLGLSIVKNLVHTKLYGTITIKSEIESYTQFTITLPKVLKLPIEAD